MFIVQKVKQLLPSFLTVSALMLPLLFVFCFHLVSSYSFDNDFGRDLVDIYAITQGDITLLGPKLSFGGLHTGPFYYYLFAPVLFLFPDQPEALLYANALLTWLALVLLGTVWKKLDGWSLTTTMVSLYWIGLSSYFLYSARGPGNAFSYVGWLILLIGIYPQIWKRTNLWLWGLYGLAWGIVVNFHLAVLFIALPLLAILAGSRLLKNWRVVWKGLPYKLVLLGGFFASFAPLLVFEVTHNFVIFKNTFIDKSYQAFTNNANLTNPLATSTNPVVNFGLFISQANSWIIPSLTILLLLMTFYLAFHWKKTAIVSKVLAISSLISLILVALVATSQLAFHYFYPFIALVQMSCIYMLAKQKLGWIFIGLAVVLSVIYFPRQWYGTSPRPTTVFRQTINQLFDTPIAAQLSGTPFAVYVTRETPLAPIGSEYRFFLLTHNLKSVEPSAYSQAELLLWFAELPLADLDGVTSWELDQFGPRRLIDQQQMGSRTVYLFAKE